MLSSGLVDGSKVTRQADRMEIEDCLLSLFSYLIADNNTAASCRRADEPTSQQANKQPKLSVGRVGGCVGSRQMYQGEQFGSSDD